MPKTEIEPGRVYRNEVPSQDLLVEFDGKSYHLPWLKLEAVTLAYFDPNKNKEMALSAAKDMGKILKALDISLAITPPSSKSEEMAKAAAGSASCDLLVLHRSMSAEDLRKEIGKDGTIVKYFPVTSPDVPKYMGIRAEEAELIAKTIRAGKKIAKVDDVYSRGGTISAMDVLIKESTKAFGCDIKEPFPSVVAIQERVFVEGEDPDGGNSVRKPGLYPVIITPILINKE